MKRSTLSTDMWEGKSLLDNKQFRNYAGIVVTNFSADP